MQMENQRLVASSSPYANETKQNSGNGITVLSSAAHDEDDLAAATLMAGRRMMKMTSQHDGRTSKVSDDEDDLVAAIKDSRAAHGEDDPAAAMKITERIKSQTIVSQARGLP